MVGRGGVVGEGNLADVELWEARPWSMENAGQVKMEAALNLMLSIAIEHRECQLFAASITGREIDWLEAPFLLHHSHASS